MYIYTQTHLVIYTYFNTYIDMLIHVYIYTNTYLVEEELTEALGHGLEGDERVAEGHRYVAGHG